MIKLDTGQRCVGFQRLQLDGLVANTFIPSLKGSPRNDVDPDAEQLLKILE
jgi:hypothetical protein